MSATSERRVFRRRQKLPMVQVQRRLVVILLMLAGGVGIVLLLQSLPAHIDLMGVVSQAVAELISGIQLILSALVGLGMLLLIAALIVLGGMLILGGLWRSVRLLQLLLFPGSLQGRR